MLESITFLSKDILSIISKYLECKKKVIFGWYVKNMVDYY